jgi:serine/threonine-protein kinase
VADIFISYARDDRAWVEPLAAALVDAGLSVWWDVRTRPGQSFDAQIEQALAEAKAVVVVWSQAALASHWVKAEAGEALQRGILIPVLKEQVVPPLLFRQLHHADLTDWQGAPHAGFDDVMAELRALVGAPPSPTSAPIDERTRVTTPPASSAPPPPERADEPTVFMPRALQPGEIVGHYRIVAPLGEGGSGAIYEARNIHNEDERVALKVVQPDIADREQFFGFLRAEANALQRVKHDAVVQFRTFGRIPDSDEFFLVIEYVEGPTLGAALRTRPFPPDALRRLAIRLADGLAAAHGQGVIHRDLSPDNVILPDGDPDRATLIDFGIARNGAFDPLGSSFAGKLSYAAPEQFAGDPAAMGPWSDLYSLGLVLAAAARGRKLDMGRDIDTAIACRSAVPDLEGVPQELHAALAALLEPDPARRVRSAAEAARLFGADARTTPEVSFHPVRIRDPDPGAVPASPPIAPPARPLLLWLGLAGGVIGAIAVVAMLVLPPKGGDTAARAPTPPQIPAVAPPQAAPAGPPVAAPAASEPPATEPATPASGVHARLVAVVEAANEAADAAEAAAARADIAAAKADEAAATASARSVEASEAAELARKAAALACDAPQAPPGHSCGETEDGERYAGEEVCTKDGCKGEGYNVYSYRDESRIEGKMVENAFVIGCRTDPGLGVYCGDLANGVPEGFGVKSFDDGRILSGAFIEGALNPHGAHEALAVDGTETQSYRGGIVDDLPHGSGTMLLGDAISIAGDWAVGRASGFGVVVLKDGTVIAAAFAEVPAGLGALRLGVITYPDGRMYAGELASGERFGAAVRSGHGVLYAADGRIARQGRWKDDQLAEDYTASPE